MNVRDFLIELLGGDSREYREHEKRHRDMMHEDLCAAMNACQIARDDANGATMRAVAAENELAMARAELEIARGRVKEQDGLVARLRQELAGVKGELDNAKQENARLKDQVGSGAERLAKRTPKPTKPRKTDTSRIPHDVNH